MHLKHPSLLPLVVGCALLFVACDKAGNKAGNSKEPPITGKPSDPPVAIDPAWKPGNRYVMRMETTYNSTLGGGLRGTQGGQQGPIETVFAQECAFTVTNAPNGHRGMEMEILSLELQSGRGDQQFINFDSQNRAAPREDNPIVSALERLIGGRVRYLVSAESKVVKVDGLKELLERVEPPPEANAAPAGDAGGRRAAARGAAGGMLRRVYNENLFKEMIELSGAPPQSVRIGEHWVVQREVTTPVVGKLLVNSTNTLRGWQEREGKKCARVDFSGELKSSGPGPDLFGGRLSVQDGKVAGTYWFDPQTGIAVESSTDQTFTVTGGGFGGGGRRRTNDVARTNAPAQAFSAPVRQTILLKLLEVRPATEG